MARKDVDLFAAAMADVKPLAGRKRPAVVPTPSPSLPPPSDGGGGPHSFKKGGRRGEATHELALDDQNFDRDIARALGRGKLVPQDSLDLHGMTLAAAERGVSRFLDQATAQDLRIVLIVTGKGVRLDGGRMLGGRIRAEFLGWLNRADNRARVRGVRPAHPRHGGSGAFYVLLRRRSSASNRSLRATPQR
jgi:DNA-nicking Smr family endonuclease